MLDYTLNDLKKIKKEDIIYYMSGIVGGGIFALFGFFIIGRILPFLSEIIYLLAGLVAATPFLIKWLTTYNKLRRIENYFPVFLRDFIESIRSGMTLSQAFKSVSNNDYNLLSIYIKKMSAQLDWGIPIDKVMTNFAKESKSKLIGRIVSTVIESHNFGGNLVDTFEAINKTATDVHQLRRERILYLQSQIITGYIVFFVFLGVIIGLQVFLTPSLTSMPTGVLSGGAVTAPTNQQDLANQYNNVYRNLILIQGLFAGLAVGKMAEGSILAGIKHSLFMMLIGFIAFTFVIGNPQLMASLTGNNITVTNTTHP